MERSVSHSGNMKIILLTNIWMAWYLAETCPFNCRCTSRKVFCRDSTIRSLPHGLSSTTELIFMEGDNLAQLREVTMNRSDLNNLTTLKLVNVHIREVETHTFRGMQKLKSLAITRNNNPALKPGAFLGLDQLNTLDLSQNGLMYLSSGVFEGLARLRQLNLSLNFIQNIHIGMFDGLSREGNCDLWQTGSVLDLSGEVRNNIIPNSFTGIHKIEDGAFDGLHCFTELKIGFYAWEETISPRTLFQGLHGLRRIRIGDVNLGPNTNMQNLYNLTHLQVDHSFIKILPKYFLGNSHLLTILTIPRNFINELEYGCFHGLKNLLYLDLSRNLLKNINHSAFEELVYLTQMNLSLNHLTTIQENAFKGLSRLKFLDLSFNMLTFLERYTFIHLVSLKDLILRDNHLRSFDSETFSVLPSLKGLLLPYTYISKDDSAAITLGTLQRLDYFEGPEYFECKNLQVIETLTFIGSGSLVAHNIETCFNQVTYLKDSTSLQIHSLNTLETLNHLSGIKISSLHLIDSNVSNFKTNSFMAINKLESLTIENSSGMRVQKGTFRNLHRLKFLKLYSKVGLELEPESFRELFNLKKLVLEIKEKANGDRFTLTSDLFEGLENVKELQIRGVLAASIGSDNFLKLENLQKLDLSGNKINSISEGSFRGLQKVQELDLSLNAIQSIGAGEFGALCRDNFTLNCANLTRITEFCNIFSVLATLTHLDLSFNDITFIHPHAFLGCNELQTLLLSWNKIQTLDFLYTPKLSILSMRYNKIMIVLSNTTFRCTSRLSNIDFFYTNLQDLNMSALEHLKNLKMIVLPIQKIDCKFRAVWSWLRRRHVQYSFDLDYYLDIDIHVSKLKCNFSVDGANKINNKTFTSNDFLYFKMYVEPVVIIFIFLSGCFGNGLLLFLILYHSDMRNKNNACIAHLAIADILSLILNLPLSYWDVEHVTWGLDETTCKFFIMSKDLVVTLVVFTVFALTLERFLVVRTSFKLKAVCGLKDVGPTLLLGTVWVYAVVTSMPSYLTATVHDRCLSSPPGREDYIQKVWAFQLLMNSLLPVAFITTLNIVTTYTLKKSISKAPGDVRNVSRYKNRNVVSNIVTILSVVFTLSYVPNALLRTLISWTVWNIEDVFWFSFLTYCLFFLHTIFNPFAVLVMSSKYKTHIMKYVRVFIKENENVNETPDVKKSFVTPCHFLLNLGEGLAGTKNRDEVVFPADIAAQDEAVRRARQERLKKLQERFR